MRFIGKVERRRKAGAEIGLERGDLGCTDLPVARRQSREAGKLAAIARAGEDERAGVRQVGISSAPQRQALDTGGAHDRLGGFGFAVGGQHRAGIPALCRDKRRDAALDQADTMAGPGQRQCLPEP